jgi:hypothetical protein
LATSTAWIRDYFDRAIAEREHTPRDTQVDFISRLLVSELDGTPIPRDDIITICYTAMLAGLDTTRSALGSCSTTWPSARDRTAAWDTPGPPRTDHRADRVAQADPRLRTRHRRPALRVIARRDP